MEVAAFCPASMDLNLFVILVRSLFGFFALFGFFRSFELNNFDSSIPFRTLVLFGWSVYMQYAYSCYVLTLIFVLFITEGHWLHNFLKNLYEL